MGIVHFVKQVGKAALSPTVALNKVAYKKATGKKLQLTQGPFKGKGGGGGGGEPSSGGVMGVAPVDWFSIYKDIFNYNLKNFPKITAAATAGAISSGAKVNASLFGAGGEFDKYFPGTTTNLKEANVVIDRWISGDLTDSERAWVARTSGEQAQLGGLALTSPMAANRERIAGVQYSDQLSTQGVEASGKMAALVKGLLFDTAGASRDFTQLLFQGSTLTPAQGIQAEQFNTSLELSKQISDLNLNMDLFKIKETERLQKDARDAAFKNALFSSLITAGGTIIGASLGGPVGGAAGGAAGSQAGNLFFPAPSSDVMAPPDPFGSYNVALG